MKSFIFQIAFLAASTILWFYDLNKYPFPGAGNNKRRQKELKFGSSIEKSKRHIHSYPE